MGRKCLTVESTVRDAAREERRSSVLAMDCSDAAALDNPLASDALASQLVGVIDASDLRSMNDIQSQAQADLHACNKSLLFFNDMASETHNTMKTHFGAHKACVTRIREDLMQLTQRIRKLKSVLGTMVQEENKVEEQTVAAVAAVTDAEAAASGDHVPSLSDSSVSASSSDTGGALNVERDTDTELAQNRPQDEDQGQNPQISHVTV